MANQSRTPKASANPYTQTYSSPCEFFAPKADADGLSAFDTVFALLAQTRATVNALARDGEDLKEGFSLSNEIICNLLWSIDTQIRQTKAALQHMAKADAAAQAGNADGVVNHA